MFNKIIKNDIKNSKFITLATLLIISIASILVSLAVILGVNLLGSIDNLMDNAKTPHFMQMHSGEIDTERAAAMLLDEFRGGKIGRITLERPNELI